MNRRNEMTTHECLSILGLTQLPSRSGLTRAYHAQIRIWHPDQFFFIPQKYAEATERCKLINGANDILLKIVKGVRSAPNSRVNRSEPPPNAQGDIKKTYPSGFPDKDVAEVYLKSKRIISVGYNNATKTLFIKSKGGIVVGYFHVHHSVFKAFVNTNSPEKFAEGHIYNHYSSARL